MTDNGNEEGFPEGTAGLNGDALRKMTQDAAKATMKEFWEMTLAPLCQEKAKQGKNEVYVHSRDVPDDFPWGNQAVDFFAWKKIGYRVNEGDHGDAPYGFTLSW